MAPKVVLITGCSTGIGLETAVLLASDKERRFRVFATMRNLAKKAQLEKSAGDTLNKTLFIRQLDVTKEDGIVKFVEKINREEGGVDILINNAGMGQGGLLEKVSMQQIRTVFETNVFGLIRMTQAVIPNMKSRKTGHIINISSFCGFLGYPFSDIYVSSKFAVEGFSESIAPLLQKFNISVSLIEPGPVATSFAGNITENKTGPPMDMNPKDLDVDELTQQCMKKSYEVAGKQMTEMTQTGKDIGLVIQAAILSEKPHLHYQTSAMTKALADAKFKDPTGDSVVKMIAAQSSWDV